MAATILGVAIVGVFLVPLVTAWSVSLFPIVPRTPHPVVKAVVFNHLLPGLVVGAVLGLATGLVSPVRRFWVVMLPAVLVLLTYLLIGLVLYPVRWTAAGFLKYLMPLWGAFFVGAAIAGVVAEKLRSLNTPSKNTGPTATKM
jgi:hypothetical protein